MGASMTFDIVFEQAPNKKCHLANKPRASIYVVSFPFVQFAFKSCLFKQISPS